MIFETKIRELSDRYLADTRAPDITGFVDQLFHVAVETGAVACVFNGDKELQFFVRPTHAGTFRLSHAPPVCVVQHEAARTILRMICARLGVICKARTGADVSPYGDEQVIHYVPDQKRWNISFINSADRQEFQIEAA